MSSTVQSQYSLRAPAWFLAAGVGGIAWNIYGVVQFARAIVATEETLVASGLTAHQAAVLIGYPGWMTLAFALGVFGGLAGSVLLLFRLSVARPVLAVSLAAYIALWLGDAFHGVFAAMGLPQVIILTFVVAVASVLFALSRHPAARA
ncbi:hypothetical protein [Rhizobium sp. RU36D]|uniref:hypothetical protein n=1 Tax=Rhizobium sp. RU36D TaxID=1907415 RepID=UPI0009D86FC9|nr:hypothetical protein [Rhizobium sp. RU36D]SMD19374.1 hypothetical protein SAMN05880593_14031 [Rhizobium sp. RU36D]